MKACQLEQFIAKHEAEWPGDLKRKANAALNSLRVMERSDNQPEVMRQLNRADLASLAAALSEA